LYSSIRRLLAASVEACASTLTILTVGVDRWREKPGNINVTVAPAARALLEVGRRDPRTSNMNCSNSAANRQSSWPWTSFAQEQLPKSANENPCPAAMAQARSVAAFDLWLDVSRGEKAFSATASRVHDPVEAKLTWSASAKTIVDGVPSRNRNSDDS
jgi:hypothetical protein